MKLSAFQWIVFGAFGFFALVGLFVFATYGGSTSSTSVGKVVIWGTLPSEPMQQALAQIAQQNQDLKGVSYEFHSAQSFESDLANAIASGAGPDLVLISQEQLVPLSSKLVPIPYTAVTQRNFLDAFADASTVYLSQNGIYGLPVVIDPLVLYYNRGLLASSGIASPPTTWEALTGLVPRSAVKTSSQNISRALIAMGSYDNVHNARGILSALFLQAGVPLVSRANTGYTVSLGSDIAAGAGVPPGEAVVRFYTQFADPSKVSYTWNTTLPDSQASFLAGNLILYMGYASEASFLRQANPNLDFDVAPLPQPATASLKADYGLVYALAMPRGSSNAAGAQATAIAMTAAGPVSSIANAYGLAPAIRALLASAPGDSLGGVSYPMALVTKTWLSPSPTATDQIFSAMIQDVITGRMTVSNALAVAAQRLFAAL